MGEFVLPSPYFTMITPNSLELSLLNFLPLAYHHSHFLAATYSVGFLIFFS